MSRTWMFVPLLLAMGVALADDAPVNKREPKAGEAQTKKAQEQKVQEQKVQEQKVQEQKSQEQKPKAEAQKGDSDNLGMSILGNQEAPKSLVIVPWKSSEPGGSVGISPMLDDSRLPVDKEVFMRALSYYEIRSETTRHDGAPARSDAPQPAPAAQRRKQ